MSQDDESFPRDPICQNWCWNFVNLNQTLKDQKKKRRNGYGFSWFWASSWFLSFSPTTDPSQVHLGQHGLNRFLVDFFWTAFFRLSGPIGFAQNLVGHPSNTHLDQFGFLGNLYPTNNQPLPSLSGPNGFLSNPVRLFFRSLFWPISTHWHCTKSWWAPFQHLFGPIWISRQSIPFQQPTLTKLIWPTWVFILSCLAFS